MTDLLNEIAGSGDLPTKTVAVVIVGYAILEAVLGRAKNPQIRSLLGAIVAGVRRIPGIGLLIATVFGPVKDRCPMCGGSGTVDSPPPPGPPPSMPPTTRAA